MRDTQGKWLPGTSGNPDGKEEGTFSILAIIRAKLQEIPEDEQRTYAELLVEQYIVDALATNDGVAIRDLVDRLDGRAVQTVTIANDLDREWLDFSKEITSEAQEEIRAEAFEAGKALAITQEENASEC